MAPATRRVPSPRLDDEEDILACAVVEREPDTDVPDGELASWLSRQERADSRAELAAGYPIEDIADALGLAPSTCEDLVDAMRRAGWTLRRPRGAHEHVQIDTTPLRARYLRRRAQARRAGEQLSLSELARSAGLVRPGREPDPTWIGRLLRLTPMPDGTLRTQIPLGLALALGHALDLDPRDIEA